MIGSWGLVAVTVAFAVDRLPVPDAAGWKDLTALAARYRLPMPTAEAELVLAHTGWRTVLGGESTSRDPGIYSPAFLLEKKSDGGAVVLRGSRTESVRRQRRTELAVRPFSP